MDLQTIILILNGVVVPIFLALGGLLVRIDRRITRIEALLKVHNGNNGNNK